MAILIRLLQGNELDLANNFFNSIYGVKRSVENFKWEFLEGPNGKAIYVIAIDDSVTQHTKVVGIQCAIPVELINGKGDVLLSAKSEDTLVDPDYRGQKIFERMYDLLFSECKNAGIKCIWGFTPAKKAFERIGFEIPFKANQGLMIFRPKKAYSYLSRLNPENKFLEKLKIAALVYMSRAVSLKRYFIRSTKLTAVKIDIASKADIINKIGSNSSLYYLNMTEKYVKWRITNNPFKNNYENYQFFLSERQVADVIINFQQNNVGYLEQILFTENVPLNIQRSVVLHTIELMKGRADLIRVMCFDINDELREQERVFRDCGLLTIKRGSYFVWKSLSPINIDPDKIFMTRLFTQGNQ